MQMISSSDQVNDKQVSCSRIYILAVGYLISLFAALSLLLIPIYITLLSILAGGALQLAASVKSPPMTWRSFLAYITPCAILAVVIWFNGDQLASYWTPRPFGLLMAWVVFFHGFRHLRYAILHSKNRATDPA
jgi:hypothetical protein